MLKSINNEYEKKYVILKIWKISPMVNYNLKKSASVKPQETSVLRKGRKTLVRGQEGLPHPHRYVTHQKHQYQHLYQHHTTQSFCPQDREGRINGGRNYYLSKSFSTLLLIFSFCNITQLIITPYSNTNVFGSWGTIQPYWVHIIGTR